MFTTDMSEFKVQQQEMHRRAAHYRLVKSVAQPNPLTARITYLLGSLLENLGRQLVAHARPAS